MLMDLALNNSTLVFFGGGSEEIRAKYSGLAPPQHTKSLEGIKLYYDYLFMYLFINLF